MNKHPIKTRAKQFTEPDMTFNRVSETKCTLASFTDQ